MNCGVFWKILVEYNEGGLTEAARLSARAHLAECMECARLAEIVSGRIDPLEGDEGLSLRRSILERTSGKACKRARSEMKRHRRGEPDRNASELLLLHLRACPSCRAVADARREGKRRRLRRILLAPGLDWVAAYAGAVLVLGLLAVAPADWGSARSFEAGPVARGSLIVPAVEQRSRDVLCGAISFGTQAAAWVESGARRTQEAADFLLSAAHLWVASRAGEVDAGRQKAWSRIHLVLRDILG